MKNLSVTKTKRALNSKRSATQSSAKKADKLRKSFGMWAKRADIDENWLAKSRARWKSKWNDEVL